VRPWPCEALLGSLRHIGIGIPLWSPTSEELRALFSRFLYLFLPIRQTLVLGRGPARVNMTMERRGGECPTSGNMTWQDSPYTLDNGGLTASVCDSADCVKVGRDTLYRSSMRLGGCPHGALLDYQRRTRSSSS
jgi:hypothetical protein